MESTGEGEGQSTQAELMAGWWREMSSLQKKSQVRNFRWRRSFFASCVESILWRTGWGCPERPVRLTLRYFIFEFCNAWFRSSRSYQTVTLVLTRMFQSSLQIHGVTSDCLRRESGQGRPYLRHRSCTWFAQVVELLLDIMSIYLIIVNTVQLGLERMLWKSPSVRIYIVFCISD